LWGSNRYDTAVAVAEKVMRGKRYLFIASGSNFADAVAAGPVVYADALPMVLAGPRGIDERTGALIAEWRKNNPSGDVVILGGNAAVSSSVESQLLNLKRPFTEEDGYFGGGFCENYPASWPRCPTDFIPVGIRSTDIERIGGSDRFDTAAKIARWAQSNIFTREAIDVGFASGVNFADALAAVNLLGQEGFNGPLLLTNLCTRIPSSTYRAASGYKSQRIVGDENSLCEFDAGVLRGKR
jgi:putative cell wall-binding protein